MFEGGEGGDVLFKAAFVVGWTPAFAGVTVFWVLGDVALLAVIPAQAGIQWLAGRYSPRVRARTAIPIAM
ncbi:hypothetical protein TH1_20495 [Thalassospira lucentensis MCCC 1A00383 = DSM 14000]|nr:hypothetical protein TH1_20495 [Thalassospira lucentensis MCCC 1A00383 = DSM 14000]